LVVGKYVVGHDEGRKVGSSDEGDCDKKSVGGEEGILVGFAMGRYDGTPIGDGVDANVLNDAEVGFMDGKRLGEKVGVTDGVYVDLIAFSS